MFKCGPACDIRSSYCFDVGDTVALTESLLALSNSGFLPPSRPWTASYSCNLAAVKELLFRSPSGYP